MFDDTTIIILTLRLEVVTLQLLFFPVLDGMHFFFFNMPI